MNTNVFANANSNNMIANNNEREELFFGNTMEVADFKAKFGLEKLNIINNPHTGKLFFTYGTKVVDGQTKPLNGMVTSSGIPEDPVVSEMLNANGEVETYMLHKRPNNNKNVIATL